MHAPADNVSLRQFLRTASVSALLPAIVCAALWIGISYATGGSTPYALGGGVLVGVIAFLIGYGLRRLIFDHRGPGPDVGQPPQPR
jgi:hypothetical protein